MNTWSKSSFAKLETCHEDLRALFNVVLNIHDCTIVYGARGQLEQDKLYQEGKSKLQYPKSKHNSSPSNAVDCIPYVKGAETQWDRDRILYFAGIVLGVAEMLYEQGKMKHKIRWGGTWSSKEGSNFANFFDGAHFELV